MPDQPRAADEWTELRRKLRRHLLNRFGFGLALGTFLAGAVVVVMTPWHRSLLLFMLGCSWAVIGGIAADMLAHREDSEW